jgi:hypothetical protein
LEYNVLPVIERSGEAVESDVAISVIEIASHQPWLAMTVVLIYSRI